MRELNVVEIEMINGAGRIQDFCVSMGVKVATVIGQLVTKFVPTINIPIIGDLGKDIIDSIVMQIATSTGKSIGSLIGGKVEALVPSWLQ